MSDFKSKLPDFKELSSMTGKLFKGIKSSVEEIIKDYKEKRAEPEVKPQTPIVTVAPEKKPTKPKEPKISDEPVQPVANEPSTKEKT